MAWGSPLGFPFPVPPASPVWLNRLESRPLGQGSRAPATPGQWTVWVGTSHHRGEWVWGLVEGHGASPASDLQRALADSVLPRWSVCNYMAHRLGTQAPICLGIRSSPFRADLRHPFLQKASGNHPCSAESLLPVPPGITRGSTDSGQTHVLWATMGLRTPQHMALTFKGLTVMKGKQSLPSRPRTCPRVVMAS